LGKARALAKRRGCTHFCVLGDLFDSERPTPPLIGAVQDVLDIRDRSVESWLLMGNHDMNSEAPSDNALSPLADHAVTIDEPSVELVDDVAFLMVPYRTGVTSEWLPGVVFELLRSAGPARARVLCLHAGIRDEATPFYLRNAADSVAFDELAAIMREHEIARTFAGNWHNHVVWHHNRIVQVGTLCPTGWSNPGLDGYGVVAILDLERLAVSFEQITGPRFVQHLCGPDSSWDALIVEFRQNADNRVLLQLVAQVADIPRWLAIPDAVKREFAAIEVVPDVHEADATVREAATIARSSVTIEHGIAEYVAAMPLSSEIDRALVQQRVQQFWQRGVA
jgi:hypothetical protein